MLVLVVYRIVARHHLSKSTMTNALCMGPYLPPYLSLVPANQAGRGRRNCFVSLPVARELSRKNF